MSDPKIIILKTFGFSENETFNLRAFSEYECMYGAVCLSRFLVVVVVNMDRQERPP